LSQEEKDRLLSVYGRTIQEQRDQLAQTDARVRDLETRTAPKPVSDADRNKGFFDAPVSTTRELIKEEVTAAIKPLTDFIQTFGPRTQYDQIKGDLMADPKYATIFAKAGRYIDEAVARTPGAVTREKVAAAALSIYGAAAAGLLPEIDLLTPAPSPAPAPAPPAPPTPGAPVPSSMQPPHLRPSPAPGPSGPEHPKPAYEFSELERRMMRENNMTEEEFLAGMNMRPDEVVKKDAWPKRGA